MVYMYIVVEDGGDWRVVDRFQVPSGYDRDIMIAWQQLDDSSNYVYGDSGNMDNFLSRCSNYKA